MFLDFSPSLLVKRDPSILSKYFTRRRFLFAGVAEEYTKKLLALGFLPTFPSLLVTCAERSRSIPH